ncbi:hypothetical protein ABH905_005219 [Pseudomonas frederiksbergensis]|uniref:hypothetical protein n=1 Tax=Pseudomonas frederiksbergensis TaxID=104087 RepID=UPI003D1E5522
MSALQSLDPVTHFLKSQGLLPEVAYFERSDYVLGWRVHLEDFELVYRCENNTLIVCNFIAKEEAKVMGRAISQFVFLIHRIERNIKQLYSVRGRFIESFSNPEINQVRERLASILMAKGASWQQIDGESWLVYPLASREGRSQ